MAAIVGAQYWSNQEFELSYSENCWSSDSVKDSSGNLLFKVKRPAFKSVSILVTDPSSLPLVGIYSKIFSLRSTWKVFPEPKSSDTPMLFLVKQSSVFQVNLSLHVFLGPNPNPDVEEPTYKVKRKAFGCSIKILRGREEELVAEANPSGCCCRRYHITISPGVDHVFALSLFLAVREGDRIAMIAGAGGGAVGAVAVALAV